jgi:hypothetical protein
MQSAPGTLTFAVDAPTGGELYECYAFDATALAHQWVTAIHWTPPPDGNVVMHHATLYALASWPNADVSTCWDMPGPATGLQVWAPGSGDLVLPSDMGIVLPSDVTRLVVQVHAIRIADGPPLDASVRVDTTDTEPARVAAWLAMSAPIPALRPHMQDTSTAACTAAAPFHVVDDWPHMHLAGQTFHGTVLHGDGTQTPLVDVDPWDFHTQRIYPVDVDVAAGDQIQTTCVWFNSTNDYIFAGPKTTDEMCNQSLLVWPATNASWEGQCL